MAYKSTTDFSRRHIGINNADKEEMLKVIGLDTLDQLIDKTVPSGIRMSRALNIPDSLSEYEYLRMVKSIAAKNKVFRNYIGQGYYDTITPSD